jgi:hypothetical protein
MNNPTRYFRTVNGSASFLNIIRTNRKKTVVLLAMAAVLIGVEALGYLRDVERPSSVEWLFKPKTR